MIVLKRQPVRFVETNRTGTTITEIPSTPDQKFWVQDYRFEEKYNIFLEYYKEVVLKSQ
jgi:hypothetical protein